MKKASAVNLQQMTADTFFTVLNINSLKCDENGENQAWEAISYHVNNDENTSNIHKERPLEKGIVEAINEDDLSLPQSLSNKGLEIDIDANKNTLKVKCDVVIVGSGCGGGVAAAVLASSGLKVLVLEKGNYFTPKDYSSLEGPSMNELFELGGTLSSKDGNMAIVAGSTVGGGSAVNWSASIKTPDYVLKDCVRRKKCLGVMANVLTENISWRIQVEAKATISSCGALSTPPLMIASGLKNKNIGRHLHLHPVLMAWGHFPDSMNDLKGKTYEGGIITSVHKVLSEEDSKVKAIIETPALGPGTFSILFPWESGFNFKERMLKYSRTVHLITIIKDKSCGEVRSEGRIKYDLDEEYDKENMKLGLQRALRILIAAGAVEVGTHRSDGQKIVCSGTNEKELNMFIESVYATGGPMSHEENWSLYSTAHQMGSCRIGMTEKEGAVDENGQSWEAEGLFVCDASLLPTAIGVNPMITIESIAYCVAKRIAVILKMA
ncbi:hypothetical protein TSUD_28210 [Trifolium subterraneum]|uniref:Long-chain-alcohol oxidase n=1 Tax=Trifolium subterraneum TaxID=3900 RepID=A0A2Z6PC10_TRISU|nr:hypothetical protein TSUD_28210 [Trifolium subterraneum]